MSADNGVYILETNIKDSFEKEYRVAHATAVENIEWSDKIYDDKEITFGDCYLVLLFGCSKIYNKKDSQIEAFQIYEDIIRSDFPICEYGISVIVLDKEFPNMTYEEANTHLQNYWNNEQKQKTLRDQ